MAKLVFIHTRLSRAYLALARLSCLASAAVTAALQHQLLHNTRRMPQLLHQWPESWTHNKPWPTALAAYNLDLERWKRGSGKWGSWMWVGE